jgi:outer membrane protein assembly factor BamB
MAIDVKTARVFVASDSYMVTAINARTGQPLRSYYCGSPIFEMVSAFGRVYVLVGDIVQGWRVDSLDSATGELQRSFAGGSGFKIAPTLPVDYPQLAVDYLHGQLLVERQSGSIEGLDARTGKLVGNFTSNYAPLAYVVDPGTQRSFLVHGDPNGTPHAVDVYDTRSQALLRTVTVPGFVTSVIVDSRRHRAFVAVQNCKGPATNPLASLPAWLRRNLPFPTTSNSGPDYLGCVMVLDTAR